MDQKLGVCAEKPYKIHDFHSNPCRHSLDNLASPSKLYRSTQNFILYRLVTDSRGLVGQKLAEKPCKIQRFHKNPCRHSLENVGWPSKLYRSTRNFMLDRLVTDSRGVVDQKLGVCAQKPYKIHGFHSNPCRHSLENVGSPSKLYRSTHNFILYRLVTDSRGVVDQKLGFGPKNHIKWIDELFYVASPCQ